MFTRTLLLFGLCWACTNSYAQEKYRIDWQTHRLSSQFYSEGATVGDFNNDGAADVASGPFWYAGPTFQTKHQFYAQDPFDPHGYSNNFFAYCEDFNDDGWDDILIYGFPGQDASWYENPKGSQRFWQRHQVLNLVDNESPTFVDINGDGRRDIVCSSEGYFGFAEVNVQSPQSAWKFRRVSDKSAGGRFTHGLGVGDVNGDGRLDIIEKNGWWQQPESLDGDPIWTKHPYAFSQGHGNAQIFAYDVDGDGDNDVICSENAHGYGLAWFEQVATENKIDFRKHVIMGTQAADNPYGVVFSQLHAVELVDVDGDGLKDIVTGKRYWAHGPRGDAQPSDPAVVYWFQLQRDGDSAQEVRWVPHLIDDDSGVGTEVDVADVNGDGAIDVVVGNKKGTYVHIQKRATAPPQTAARISPRARDLSARPAAEGLPAGEGLEPKAAAKAITVPDGFHVQLAAGEPMVHQPIAMAFDHRGRLWVAEAHTYPIRAAEGEGQDKIIILEDTDHDGEFDSRTVFIDGLNLVSGMEVGFGGVWVGAAPYLMFIPDRDGDDIPDGEPEILLDGFGYQDTHETLNAFIWGPDGWLYGCHGVFTHSKVGKPGTPDDQRLPLNCGVWRYHPVRHQFEMFARGTSNPWGVDFNDYGQAFITACVIPHMYHIIQGARYQRQGGQHFNPYLYDDIKTIADHAHYAGNIRDHAWWGRDSAVAHNDTDAAGGGHAHCGAMIYLGDNWPVQYRGSIFMANIHGNRINNDRLRRVGSGYVAAHGEDILFANDRWFRAINMKYAPDGSVYVIDWYDKNACHRRDKEIWDRTNGRIYRVSFATPKPQAVDLAKLNFAELVELHLHENEWYVRMARRILQERMAQASARGRQASRHVEHAALSEIFTGHKDVKRRLRALWTAHVCGLLAAEDIGQLLEVDTHKSEYIRGWAIQLDLEDGQSAHLEKLAELARSDESSLVRLYLASALQQLPLEERWPIAEGLLRHGDDAFDHNLPLMIWYGIEPLVVEDPTRAIALAADSRIPLVRQFIYRRAAADPVAINDLLAALSKADDVSVQKMMLGEIAAAVSKQGRLKMPTGWPVVYAKLAAIDDQQVREQAQLITVKFGDSSIFPLLREIVTNKQAKLSSRQNALAALISGKDSELPPVLISLLDDAEMRAAVIRGLAGYEHAPTADAIIGKYASFAASEKSDAVLTLVSRVAFAAKLLDAVEKEQIPRQHLSAVAIRQIELLGDKALVEKVNKVWGTMRSTPAEKRAKIDALKKQLTPQVIARADLSHGRLVYDNVCGKCHRLFGSGGDIGPDITGSNRADLDYTLQNMIDPNALIGKDYQATQILTGDGRVITGLLKEENDSAIVIQTANEKLVIDKADIEERTLSKVSMMPEGQLDQMKPAEVRDLIAYLASPTQVPRPGEGPMFDQKSGKVSGAIEGESMKVLNKTAGDAQPQGMSGFKADRWSGANHLWWTGAKKGDRLEVAIPASQAGEYEVFVAMTKARDYGIVKLGINGHAIEQEFDLFNGPAVISTGVVSLGVHKLQAGDNRLTVEIVGANPEAVKSFMFGLDYVYLAAK